MVLFKPRSEFIVEYVSLDYPSAENPREIEASLDLPSPYGVYSWDRSVVVHVPPEARSLSYKRERQKDI